MTAHAVLIMTFLRSLFTQSTSFKAAAADGRLSVFDGFLFSINNFRTQLNANPENSIVAAKSQRKFENFQRNLNLMCSLLFVTAFIHNISGEDLCLITNNAMWMAGRLKPSSYNNLIMLSVSF